MSIYYLSLILSYDMLSKPQPFAINLGALLLEFLHPLLNLFFYYALISFSCHFYINQDIDMRFFVTCSGHRDIFLSFFRYYRLIFRDGTKDTKRGKFQVTGCQNVIMLSQDVPFFF